MTNEEARDYFIKTFMEYRTQETVFIEGPSANRTGIEELGANHEVWGYSDDLPMAPMQYDVKLVFNDWPGHRGLARVMSDLRPGGLLAGYTHQEEHVDEAAIERVLKELTQPVGECQIFRKEEFIFWRCFRPPMPGLTLAYFCDGRAAETLPRAIASMQFYAREVLVLDTGIDGDEKHPRLDESVVWGMGAKVFRKPSCDDFAAVANAIRYKASHEWILLVGDDCRFNEQSAPTLYDLAMSQPSHVYSLQFWMKMVGPKTWEEDEFQTWCLPPQRLFRNRWWIFFSGHVHEQIQAAMAVAGFPMERHNVIVPKETAYCIHWEYEPWSAASSERKADWYAMLQSRDENDAALMALEHNAVHQKFDARVYESPAQSERVRLIVEACEGSVLDLGSGDGWIVDKIAKAGHEVVGIERSRVRRYRAHRNFGIQLQDGDVTQSLPFEDGSFDTVAGCEILEHLDNPGPTLTEMARVARKRLIVSLPICELFDNDPMHVWGIRAKVICEAGVPQMLLLVCDKINRGAKDGDAA